MNIWLMMSLPTKEAQNKEWSNAINEKEIIVKWNGSSRPSQRACHPNKIKPAKLEEESSCSLSRLNFSEAQLQAFKSQDQVFEFSAEQEQESRLLLEANGLSSERLDSKENKWVIDFSEATKSSVYVYIKLRTMKLN